MAYNGRDDDEKRSPKKELAIDRIRKDNALKELTLARQKVKEVTREKNKLQNALIQVNNALRYEHGH